MSLAIETRATSLRELYPQRYPDVREAIRNVYECGPEADLTSLANLTAAPIDGGVQGCPADAGVLVAKWLFAEQDLTYWNNSGRAMLFGKLREDDLA